VIYNRLGRAALRFALAYLRRRYRREIRIGIGIGAAAATAAAVAYLAGRGVPEG
jgi:GTP cyclohydrolase III